MSKLMTRELVADKAIVHAELRAAPAIFPAPAPVADRTFEMPHGIYVAMLGLFLGFLATMAIALPSPEMVLPMVIFAVFVLGFFGVPALWVRMAPERNGSRASSWDAFLRNGIMTSTGHCTGKAAAIQALIIPVVVFGWGLAIVAIRAIVS